MIDLDAAIEDYEASHPLDRECELCNELGFDMFHSSKFRQWEQNIYAIVREAAEESDWDEVRQAIRMAIKFGICLGYAEE